MNVAVMKTKAEAALGEQFEAAAARLPGTGWVKDLRKQAIGVFEARGLPHRRIEEWKYTDLRERLREALPPAFGVAASVAHEAVDAALGPLATLDADRIVFVDGRYDAALSQADRLGSRVEFKTMGEVLATAPKWLAGKFDSKAIKTEDSVRALNLAFMTDGVLLKIGEGHVPERPVLLVFARSADAGQAITTRNIVAVEAGAKVTLIEAHVALPGAAKKAQVNTGTDIAVAEGAEVAHIKCVADVGEIAHLATWAVQIGEAASYRGFQLTAGTQLARNQVFATFAGEGAKLDISGCFLGRGSDHIDTTLVVDHAVPGCESRELFKGVLDGRARGVFQGKVIVRQDAQKTDGKQMAQVLMLSPDAEFDSKPELEIYADDVVCGHGSTCAEIDPEMMFYLRSRGIPQGEARALLIDSFAGEAIEKVEREDIRDALMQVARQWLKAA
ncbi:MAG: Fe-S cluster assembly protein SufD [Sphingomonadales bacterium]|nr:Fe-S cluster assembly protein SufD [Sphingomonadales bacterium]